LEGLRVDALGQLMWIRLGLSAFLRERPERDTGFGFLPSAAQWRVGVVYFGLFFPLGAGLILGLKYAEFAVANGWWWQGPATFFAFLWVVALAEEFFFRGVLQRTLSEKWNPLAGLAAASVAFGLVHLPFREFPNWKHVIIATVLGIFCGLGFQKTGSIRAPMVTHALVVAAWRMFFR